MTPAELAELRALILLDVEMRRRGRAKNQCAGKHGYASYVVANGARRPHMGGSVQPYKCMFCHLWHLGNHDTRRKRVAKLRG